MVQPCAAVRLEAVVSANPDNVLSAIVRVRAGGGGEQGIDSVAVRYAGDAATGVGVTPAVRMGADTMASTTIPVLGLWPEQGYSMQVVGYTRCGSIDGAPVAFTTGSLPADLPTYTASGSAPTPGYVAFAASPFGIVIDNTGRVVWYHRFPNGSGLNFQSQPSGTRHWFAMPPGQPLRWVEIDPLGAVVRTFGCARNLQPRFHDLIVRSDSSVWLMCDETRPMDLTAFGGVARAQVTGTVVQHLAADGRLLFEWSAFDHFALTDLDPLDRQSANVNWTHGNAIDLDRDGNLIASFRSLSEITKISTTTGAVLWRMGGRAGQYAFENSDRSFFERQHGVRVASSGELLLLDNLSDPTASRAKRIAYDLTTIPPRVRLVASYGSQPSVVALLGGTTQELANGRTLVAYGNGGRVEEYDVDGKVVWRIDGSPGYVFRAQRIASLYQPGAFGR